MSLSAFPGKDQTSHVRRPGWGQGSQNQALAEAVPGHFSSRDTRLGRCRPGSPAPEPAPPRRCAPTSPPPAALARTRLVTRRGQYPARVVSYIINQHIVLHRPWRHTCAVPVLLGRGVLVGMPAGSHEVQGTRSIRPPSADQQRLQAASTDCRLHGLCRKSL